MKNKDLIKSFDDLGFPLFEVEKHRDANRALADIVKSKDMRFWEGFPVVLANSAERGLFSYDNASILLKRHSERATFDSLIALSLAIYDFFSLKFSWSGSLRKGLPIAKQKESAGYVKELKEKDKDGNTVTRQVETGRTRVKVDRISSLANDLALALAASSIRIEAPIPGKSFT